MKTIQEIAADIARELREDPTRWTQHTYARDQCGIRTSSTDPAACQWCFYGHVIKRNYYSAEALMVEANQFAPGEDMVAWNDAPERTVDDVIALCDKVAAS